MGVLHSTRSNVSSRHFIRTFAQLPSSHLPRRAAGFDLENCSLQMRFISWKRICKSKPLFYFWLWKNMPEWLYVQLRVRVCRRNGTRGREHYFIARAFDSGATLIKVCAPKKQQKLLTLQWTAWVAQRNAKETLRPEIKMYKKSTIKMIYNRSSNQYQWYCNIFVISARFSPRSVHECSW